MFRKIFLLSAAVLMAAALNLSGQWKQLDNLPPEVADGYWLDIFVLPENHDYIWICGYNAWILMSTDGGESWKSSQINDFGGYDGQLESLCFVNDNVGYVSGEDWLYKTTDGGDIWFDDSPNEMFPLWGNYFINEDVGMVVGGGCQDRGQYFMKTSNGGRNWTKYQDNVPNTGLTHVLLYPDSNNDIDSGYAVSSGYLWKSIDGGDTWERIGYTGESAWHEDLDIIGNTILVPYSGGCMGGGPGGVRISHDEGRTWKDTYFGVMIFGTHLINQQKGWACGYDGAAYYTSDGGENWLLRNEGLEEKNLDAIYFFDEDHGIAVGEGAFIWEAVESAEDIPMEENTLRIRPIPAQDNVNIEFTLETASKINLSIYDCTGRRVAVLADGEFLAPGSHRRQWLPAGALSGLYLCRLVVGGECRFERILLK